MDAIELNVLKWYDDLIATWDELSTDLKEKLPKASQFNRARQLIGDAKEDALCVARHYTQALRMREAAMRGGNFSYYVASTYALTHDWGVVLRSIKWAEWGCFTALGDSLLDLNVRKVTVLVAGMGRISDEELEQSVQSFARANTEEILFTAQDRGLIALHGEHYYPGPRVPKPSRKEYG